MDCGLGPNVEWDHRTVVRRQSVLPRGHLKYFQAEGHVVCTIAPNSSTENMNNGHSEREGNLCERPAGFLVLLWQLSRGTNFFQNAKGSKAF